MEEEYIVIFFLLVGLMGLVGMAIGNIGGKQNGDKGFILGALLGPIGWIIVAVVPPREGSLAYQQNWKSVELQQRTVSLLEALLAEMKKTSSIKTPTPEKTVTSKPIITTTNEDSNVYRLD